MAVALSQGKVEFERVTPRKLPGVLHPTLPTGGGHEQAPSRCRTCATLPGRGSSSLCGISGTWDCKLPCDIHEGWFKRWKLELQAKGPTLLDFVLLLGGTGASRLTIGYDRWLSPFLLDSASVTLEIGGRL